MFVYCSWFKGIKQFASSTYVRWYKLSIYKQIYCHLTSLPAFRQSYARMCWILQHQATYLTQLSQYIHGDEEIFLEAIDALFGDVKDLLWCQMTNDSSPRFS